MYNSANWRFPSPTIVMNLWMKKKMIRTLYSPCKSKIMQTIVHECDSGWSVCSFLVNNELRWRCWRSLSPGEFLLYFYILQNLKVLMKIARQMCWILLFVRLLNDCKFVYDFLKLITWWYTLSTVKATFPSKQFFHFVILSGK